MGLPDLATSMAIGTLVFAFVAMVMTFVINSKVGGFKGHPSSEWGKGMFTSGASMRMQGTCRDDGPAGSSTDCIGFTGGSSFLGGPEPPVFYDIGDVGLTRASLYGEKDTKVLEQQLKAKDWTKGTGENVIGFRGGREQVYGLSPY